MGTKRKCHSKGTKLWVKNHLRVGSRKTKGPNKPPTTPRGNLQGSSSIVTEAAVLEPEVEEFCSVEFEAVDAAEFEYEEFDDLTYGIY